MQLISGRKLKFWRTFIRAVQANTIPEHGLKGKPSNNTQYDQETMDDLRAFFDEIKAFCDVIPTRFIRNITRLTTRDDTDSYTLPPYWSKRSLYARWCYDCGWNIETSTKAVITKHRRLDWPDDVEPQPVISYTYFFVIWKQEYSYIVVRRPTADICDDCYLFYNQVKFRSRIQSPFIDVDSTDDEDDEEEEDNEDNEVSRNAIKLDWKTQTTIQEADDMETMVLKASNHVARAKDMREMLIGKAQLALKWYQSIRDCSVISESAWIDAVDTIVGDYCQNMGLPQLGEHQPGETYYFSPLTVNCFGLANVGLEKATLTSYIYHEGEGKKGGNNVASLIFKYLDDNGLINRGQPPRKELNIVMDNCGGQNKN
jgi:hypothetical protein